MRLVLRRDATADGVELVVDPRRRLPGRGLNVHARARCLDRALAPRALARALRVDTAPAAEAVRARLLEDVHDPPGVRTATS